VGAERLPPIPIPSFSAGGMSLTMPLIVEGLGNFAGRTRGPVKSAPTARVRDGYLATSLSRGRESLPVFLLKWVG
jgi:hypothetical protein